METDLQLIFGFAVDRWVPLSSAAHRRIPKSCQTSKTEHNKVIAPFQ